MSTLFRPLLMAPFPFFLFAIYVTVRYFLFLRHYGASLRDRDVMNLMTGVFVLSTMGPYFGQKYLSDSIWIYEASLAAIAAFSFRQIYEKKVRRGKRMERRDRNRLTALLAEVSIVFGLSVLAVKMLGGSYFNSTF